MGNTLSVTSRWHLWPFRHRKLGGVFSVNGYALNIYRQRVSRTPVPGQLSQKVFVLEPHKAVFAIGGSTPPTGLALRLDGRNIAPMATEPDYYIATAFDTGQRPFSWRWELRRHSSPMGVRIGSGGYQTRTAAEFAGKRALEGFLKALAREERQRR